MKLLNLFYSLVIFYNLRYFEDDEFINRIADTLPKKFSQKVNFYNKIFCVILGKSNEIYLLFSLLK